MSFLSTAVQNVLEQGQFCHVATSSPNGPHCTPLVFAYSGGRLWLTTSRRSVKTRQWKVDPSVAGLVRRGGLAVTFTGTTKLYDALDRSTWGSAVAGATSIGRATAGFSKKNARFFAGYALDAKQVPFAWTPPGRVFAELRLERTAILESGRVASAWGDWGDTVEGVERFRAARAGQSPLAGVPERIRDGLGESGEGALALAEAGPEGPAALTVDHASEWRARDMVGAMVQGTASLYVLDELGSGAKTARSLATGIDPDAGALVRFAPSRLVWWHGWSSGSASVG